MLDTILKLILEFARSGEKLPSRSELFDMAKAAAQSEAEALRMSLLMSDMTSAASRVLTAFRTKPQEVPILDIDIEIVSPDTEQPK